MRSSFFYFKRETQICAILVGVYFLFLTPLYPSFSGLVLMCVTMTVLFNFLFRIFLLVQGFFLDLKGHYKINNEFFTDWVERNWSQLPSYNVFVPLYYENAFTIKRVISSLDKMLYDKPKLKIILLLEKMDQGNQVLIMELIASKPEYEVLILPHSYKNTSNKPRALNYALASYKSDCLCIYDAEDVPDKDQLLKAVYQMERHNCECVQAVLTFENRNKNFITRCFEMEYHLWFRYMAKSVAFWDLCFPLGGTSCHFKREVMDEMTGWDSFNVTEDAEIGCRIKQAGYKTVPLDSVTVEECPSNVSSWINQRSRWIKGFIGTYCAYIFGKMSGNKSTSVNNKKPKKLWSIDILLGASGLHYIVSLIIFISPHNHPIHLLNVIYGIMMNLSIASLILFYIISIIFFIMIHKNTSGKKWHNVLLIPIYFGMHVIASISAYVEICLDCSKWMHTAHFFSRKGD